MKIKADICIVGAGSGGIGAAYRAAMLAPDKKIVLIESRSVPGGTSTIGGVNAWEPGVTGKSKLHKALYSRLRKKNQAVISNYVSIQHSPRMIAFVCEIPSVTYEETCTGTNYKGRVIFDPKGMIYELQNILNAFDNLTILYNCPLTDVSASGGRVNSVSAYLSELNELVTIESSLYVDSSADIIMARMAGCETSLSENPNGLSQMFIVETKNMRSIDEVPKWVYSTEAVDWIKNNDPGVIFNQYPDGSLNANTLPTMDGSEYLNFGAEAKKIAIARTYMLWNALQKEREMDNYRISYIFPMLGIREGHRLVGKYVLNENDLMTGYDKQPLNEHIIAIADHSIDFHHADHKNGIDLKKHYGIPYECMLPKSMENLAVACRGISLTQIAAASCRLQRTMMQLGEAAGVAAVLSKSSSFYDVDMDELISML